MAETKRHRRLLAVIAVLILAAGCARVTPTATATPAPTAVPPTATAPPTATTPPTATPAPTDSSPTAVPVEAVSQEQAAQTVISQLADPDSVGREVIVFAWPELLTPEDRLEAYQPPEWPGDPRTLDIPRPSWFFWVDDAPGARFVHPSRFVLVDASSGALSATDQQWWPVLNGRGLWVEADDYWDEGNWAFSNVGWRPTGARQAAGSHVLAASHAHIRPGRARSIAGWLLQPGDEPGAALVINGWRDGEAGREGFRADGDGMHDVLTGSGFDVVYLGSAPGGSDIVDGPPDPAAIDGWFDEQAPEIDSGKALIVYVTGHGFADPSGQGFAGPVSEGELPRWLERADPGADVIVILDSAKSGSFLDGTRDVADLTLTSTGPQGLSYGDIDPPIDPNPDDVGGEFSSSLILGWNRVAAEKAQAEREQLSETISDPLWAYLLDNDAASLSGSSEPALGRGSEKTAPDPTLVHFTGLDYGSYDYSAAYQALMGIKLDVPGHGPHAAMPEELPLDVQVVWPFSETVAVTLTTFHIRGQHPWVDVTGTLQVTGTLYAYTYTVVATGTGTVAGYDGVDVRFTGAMTDGTLYGDYEMGFSGRLPTGLSITYWLKAVRIEEEPPPTPTPAPTPTLAPTLTPAPTSLPAPTPTPAPTVSAPGVETETPEEFLALWVDAMHDRDAAFLFVRLHPAVLERYGADACRPYLDQVIDPQITLSVLAAGDPEPWVWEMDGRSTLIEAAHPVEVEMVSRGQTVRQVMHVALVDGVQHWFTDCGEPLP